MKLLKIILDIFFTVFYALCLIVGIRIGETFPAVMFGAALVCGIACIYFDLTE